MQSLELHYQRQAGLLQHLLLRRQLFYLLQTNLKGKTMKKIIASILLLASFSAIAACPPYSPYGCRQGMNGKMICGCGIR
jgi:hypothetical protein